jgi:DNA modification methylase
MVTDPPYGVEYDADWRNNKFLSDGSPFAGRAVGKVENDDQAGWTEAWNNFQGDVAYVWHASTKSPEVHSSLIASGFESRALIVWAKSNLVISRGHYHHQHEPCWYMVRKGKTGHWAGDRKQTTLWEIQKPNKSETGHSTQKPIECMMRPMINNSEKGDAVYEPFSGSGTTIMAGEQSGRRVFAMEISPVYVDVAVKRFIQTTGKIVFLDGSGGKRFEDVAAERGVAI